ncbi:hypothetical protein DICA1_C11760 [Diutina catenulata]
MEQVWTNSTFSPQGFDSPGGPNHSHHHTPQSGSTPQQSQPSQIDTPMYLVSEQESQFLNQLEHNFYEGPTPNGGGGDDFFLLPDDVLSNNQGGNQVPGHTHQHQKESTAYPPSAMPQNTPALLAKKGQPYDPSLELDQSATFASPILPGQNDRSYNDEHFYHKQNNMYNNHKPPAQGVRPDAVFTPLVSPAVTPMDKYQQNSSSVPVAFEPLTSPALNAISGDNERRRSSSAAFAPPEDYSANKRRTPHGTPIMAPVKSSTSLKSQAQEFRQPEQYRKPGSASQSPSANGTPLMGFTMGVLAEQENQPATATQKQRRAVRPSKPRTQSQQSLSNQSSPSTRTSPSILPSQAGPKSGKREKPATKQASHKLAEQGRRNRMNQAVHDLGLLIPKSYHDEVSIPSKATTVELASKYIADLQHQITQMGGQLEKVKEEA